MYYKLNNTFTVFCDIDDTLVIWGPPSELKNHPDVFYITSTLFSESVPVLVHWEHVEQLKAHKLRGHQIVIWSYGGSDWGAEVVKALGLTEYVDVVCCKPDTVYDDLQKEDILLKRSYIPFHGYKEIK